jgi:hypothetical protein
MTMEELSVRLEKVERQNRRLRAGGSLALVLIVALAALGQVAPSGKVVSAERFEVRDSGGKLRSLLAVIDDGVPALAFYDADGKGRALIGVNKDGFPHLEFLDKDRKTLIGLAVSPDGSPGLGLRVGEMGSLLTAGTDGSQSLSFIDKGGSVRAGLTIAPDGSPAFLLFDKDGKVIERLPK